jgi:hypothetical protein
MKASSIMAKANGKGKCTLSEKQGNDLLKQVCACKPLMTQDQMFEFDRVFQTEHFSANLRYALGVATMGGPFFKSFKTDRETAVMMAGIFYATGDQIDFLKGAIDVFKSVQTRLMVALAARRDMDAVLAEGEATLESSPGH